MTLPTVLVTDVIRSAHQGESHGGVHLVDLERGSHQTVLDWNDDAIDWTGRGGDRGLRGIALWRDKTVIAASNEVFLFNADWSIEASFRCANLSHIHEIALVGDALTLTSTRFDAIITLDLARGVFTQGAHLSPGLAEVSTPEGPRRRPTLIARPFDPSEPPALAPADRLHINSVSVHEDRIHLAGVRLNTLFAAQHPGALEGPLTPIAPLPLWTHNAQRHAGGVIYNATEQDETVIASLTGESIRRFKMPTTAPADLTHTDLPGDHARAGFARGLIHAEGLVIVGVSPTTVAVFDEATAEHRASVCITRDIRNAAHGLVLWPENRPSEHARDRHEIHETRGRTSE